MPPQRNEMDGGSHHDRTPAKNLSVFLSKHDALNCSIETDSTSSTESDSVFSKDSKEALSSVDNYEIETPRSLRHQVFRSFDNNEFSNQIWRLNDSDHSETPGRGKKKNPKVPHLFYYSLASIILCFSLAAIKSSDSNARKYAIWRRFLEQDAPRIQNEIQAGSPGNDFTIRLKGSRLDLMQQSLDAHSRCSSVKQIQIDFGGSQHIPEMLLSHEVGKASPIDTISTSGVFLLSEDVILPCDEIEKGKACKSSKVPALTDRRN
jgi:hypothetical protein